MIAGSRRDVRKRPAAQATPAGSALALFGCSFGSLLLLLLSKPGCFLARHGHFFNEVDKPFAIFIWRKSRNLTAITRKAFPEVLELLDNAVLQHMSVRHPGRSLRLFNLHE